MSLDFSFVQQDWNTIMAEIGLSLTRKRPTYTTDDMGRTTNITYDETTIKGWLRPVRQDDAHLIAQGFEPDLNYIGIFWASDVQVGDIIVYNEKELKIIEVLSSTPVGGNQYIVRVKLV